MKRKVLFTIYLSVCALLASAQADIWSAIQKVEANKYIINIPDAFKRVSIPEGAGTDFKFDLSGVGLSATVNGAPMYGFYTVSHLSGHKEAQALEQCQLEFSSFYDRVTEPGYNFDTTTATIQTGQSGTLLHTRYYRRSKVSNYSRYFLIVYADKADETYVLSVTFQYKDPGYDIERSAALGDYVRKVFAHFELR
ncbi:MAG: hypothetical protein JST76_09195 [Bacteroidetes bacterium]|nr:hypothetical protein [Bacteroidota bacterium]